MPTQPLTPAARRPAALLAALACVLALAAAACGGEDAGEGTTVLEVGVVPIADVAPLYLGRRHGFFRAEGLTVRPRVAEGGAAIVPAVVGGQLDFGFSNTVSLLIAAAGGEPVQIVAQGAMGGTDERRAWADLLVRANSGITSGKDLEGRTIAVNSLNNICEVTIKASLAKQGVDVSSLEFTEVPFPEMSAALKSGRADGACAVEPFLTEGEAAGARGIDPFYVRTAPDLTVATWFTSRDYGDRHPRVVARFVRAMNRSLEYAARHPAEVREVLPDYMRITPAIATRIRLPTWRADLNRPTIEKLGRLTERYGLIERQPDLDTLLRAGS